MKMYSVRAPILVIIFVGLFACSSSGTSTTNNGSGTATYSITGKITDSSNAGIAGVSIALSGATVTPATTASDGTYSFTGIANGTYTLTPTKTDYICTPTSKTVTVNGANIADVNFTGSSASTENNKITISGRMDNASVMLASKEGPLKKFLAFISLAKKAYASGSALSVDNIIAVSPDGMLVKASKSDDLFSLDLDKGKPYVIALLSGATVQALYKTDAATDMDAFPINANSTNMDLGTLSISTGTTGTVAQGTISSSALISDLGISLDTASAFAAMGKGYARFANIDVDGNNIIDQDENKSFGLKIDFTFLSTPFSSITATWTDKNDTSFETYIFIYRGCPDVANLDWSKVSLRSPQNFTVGKIGMCDSSVTPNVNDEIASTVNLVSDATYSTCRGLNFFEGCRSISSPMPPPAGTYTVNVPVSSGTGTQSFIFKYVATPDMTNMQNIYVPEIKLTRDTNNKITLMEWRWWRKSSGAWLQPTSEELSLLMNWVTYAIVLSDFSTGVSGSLPVTPSGSVVPPAQSFIPGGIRINIGDMSQYDYAFEFR